MPVVPSGQLPLLGHAHKLRDPDAFFRQQRDELGHSCLQLSLPGGERTFLLDPRDFPAVLRHPGLKFREFSAEVMDKVFGVPDFIGRGDDLDRFSHLITRYMKGEHLEVMTERMEQQLAERLRSATTERFQDIELYAFLNDHFFAAGLEALFGDGANQKGVFDAYALTHRRFNLLASGVPAKLLFGVERARKRLAEAVSPHYPGRAKLFEERDKAYWDFGFTKAQRDLSEGSLIWASQANTVASAFWTLLYVLRSPVAREALRAELEEATGGRGSGGLDTQKLSRMKLLDSATMEAMRLTSASIVTRRAEEPVELELRSGERLSLKRGASVFLYSRLTHLDPEVFSDPYVFHHDRFMPGKSGPPTFHKDGEKLAFAFVPFGAGVSTCPGRFFAKNEIKVIVASLLSAYDIELGQAELPDIDMGYLGLGILPPKGDVRVRIRRRGEPQPAEQVSSRP